MIPSTARKAVNGAGDVEMDEEDSKKNFGSVPLLTMLAEVASAELESDTVLVKDSAHKARKSVQQADALVLDQIRILSDRVLLESFSEFTSNEMRRTFSYRCYLMPSACAETFSSFGNEHKARSQMKSHLLSHIAELLAEANAPGRQGKPPFMAEPLQARKRRLQESEGTGRKRKRPQPKQPAAVSKNERRTNGSSTVLHTPTPRTVVKKSQARVKSQVKPSLVKPEGKNSRPMLKVAVKSLTTPTNKVKAPSVTGKVHNTPVKEEKQLRVVSETWEAHVVRRDHSYWGPGCPLAVDNDDDSDLEELCSDCVERRPAVPSQSVIATPAFPYVYVPLLPNTSSVVEVTTPGGGIGGGSAKRRALSPMLPSSDDDDDDEDEDDDDEEEEQRSKQPQLQHPVAKGRARLPGRRGAAVQATETSLERKAALKHIKALRNKRRDERGPLVCKICKTKVFTAQATLMYHYRSHAGIKPFNCKICEATFTRQHSLNYHMLIHNNKSRFECEDCGRHFRHPSHFKEHLRRHTGETPYQCTDCNQRFKTRNTYKRHLKTRHGKILTAQGILSVGESRPTSPAPT
ncbi:E3 ubiquitin-protein ligase ZFP91 isoform X1 [Rhipicephalus sanguineus]|uniref:E3 ubiquitin-protein ligase ZFP91 isoform X1 n=1 Tax=Rhipicephalus sanguineus TaxID=34632 RepID=UPI0020C358C1|nr:E3 ubiquitin-protein ligase ZFP91 isoform X1 [Rhipicephalus sanguineus]